MKKSPNIINKLYPLVGVAVVLMLWQALSSAGIIAEYLLPSPVMVFRAFFSNFPEMMNHAAYSLTESFSGLFASVALGFLFGYCMDRYDSLYKTLYPLLILTQTVPVVAIAPLLVLWFGYGMAPKMILIIIVCFFPLTIAILDGFRSVDKDMIDLMKAMGAKKRQIYTHVKIPSALPNFFSGLKMAVSYAVIGAVIAEWLGGNQGLGVYMTRVRKSYSFDKMFAVIFLISLLSLILMGIVKLIEKKAMPWKQTEN